MIARQSQRSLARPGYTLLEMTLALAISLIILGAIYEFLNRQITSAEVGRELVEESHLVRGILDKMAKDIVASLGAVDPQQLPDVSTDSVDALLQAETFTPLFNSGVDGTSNVLILSVSRVPIELLAPDKRQVDASTLKKVSDLRRTSYWFVDDGNTTGLACQVLTGITSDEFYIRPPDVGDIGPLIIAEEVRGLVFEYFDGVNWQATWSGNAFASDGQTPMGPPAAIKITLTVASKDGLRTRDYRRVVALPAGNNFLSQQIGS